MSMNLGNKIQKLRIIKGLKQDEMSERLKITQSAYSKMEVGTVDIPFSKLEEIATILEIPIENIIGFNEHLIFNLTNNKKATGLLINNQISQNEKLYSDYIEALKTENLFLKQTIQTLLLNKKK